MTVQDQIRDYIAGQAEPKRSDLEALHQRLLQRMPDCRLWFLDGKDERGKTVSNPNIGYGCYVKNYADGKSRAFFQIGLSTNTTGISVYVMGIEDRAYLPQTYGKAIGKASVTGYCIKFKALKDIDMGALEAAIADGLEISARHQ